MKVGNNGSGVWGGVVGVTDKARCKTRKSPTCYSARKFQGEEKRKGVRVLLQLKASRFSLEMHTAYYFGRLAPLTDLFTRWIRDGRVET